MTRFVGVNELAPRLPQGVISASQGATVNDLAPGNVLAAGGTVTGPLIVNPGPLRAATPADFWSAGGSVFIDQLGSLGSMGSWRLGLYCNGYRNATPGWTDLAQNGWHGSAAVELDPNGGTILFRAQATAPASSAGPLEVARIVPPNLLLIGKTASSVTVQGSELYDFGLRVVSAASTLAALDVRHLTGATPLAMNVAWNGTQIGSVARNGTNNGVLFNTTSHGPWKAEIGPIADADALATIRAYRPIRYQWKLNGNGQMSASGSPSGPEERGLIAQEAAAVNASAVSPGEGEEWQEGFRPWQLDYGRITPDLIAAIQALDRRLSDLEAA